MGIHDVVVDNRTVSSQTVHKIVEHPQIIDCRRYQPTGKLKLQMLLYLSNILHWCFRNCKASKNKNKLVFLNMKYQNLILRSNIPIYDFAW